MKKHNRHKNTKTSSERSIDSLWFTVRHYYKSTWVFHFSKLSWPLLQYEEYKNGRKKSSDIFIFVEPIEQVRVRYICKRGRPPRADTTMSERHCGEAFQSLMNELFGKELAPLTYDGNFWTFLLLRFIPRILYGWICRIENYILFIFWN